MSKFKVWHIPQIPGKPFEVETETLNEADIVMETLALYDLFQFENNIKPDYSNASGVLEFVDDEWEELDSFEIDERLGRL